MFDLGKFNPKGNARSPYVVSVASELLLGEDDMGHAFGCRLAARINDKKRQRLMEANTPFADWEDSCFYLGSYRLEGRDILGASLSIYDVSVYQIVEDGEEAHCNIELSVKMSIPVNFSDFKEHSRDDRNRLLNWLFEKMHAPSQHICDHDQAFQDRLNPVHESVFGRPLPDAVA